MSLKAINWMAKQTTGDDKMKSALFWLAFHLNDETGECFPSISTLQAEMEVKSDNTVRGALRRLREAGFISLGTRNEGRAHSQDQLSPAHEWING